MSIDIPIDPNDVITDLVAEAQHRLETNDDIDQWTAIHETIENHRDAPWNELQFVEQMYLLDHLTTKYDIADQFEPEQVSTTPYSVHDWREAVITGYMWQLLATAIRTELDGK